MVEPSSHQQPLVTIGITCHDAVDTVGRAVESALRQDWPRFEVVVVDDRSTDGSWDVLQAIAAEMEAVRVIRHERNTGVAGARTTLIATAKGEFLAFFDDDDESERDRLPAQYERIIAYEHRTGAKAVLCYADRYVVGAKQTAPVHVGLAIGRHQPEPHGRIVAHYLLGLAKDPRFVWGMCGSGTLMARTSVFRSVGGFDPAFRRNEEADMAVRAALMGAHFIAVDRPLIIQYKTQGTDKSGRAPLKYALLLREKHRDYFESTMLYRASRLLAHANFHGNKRHRWRSGAYRALAWCLAPQLFFARLRARADRALAAANAKASP